MPNKQLSKFFYSSAIFTCYMLFLSAVIYYLKVYVFNNTYSYDISHYVSHLIKFYLTGDMTDMFKPPPHSNSLISNKPKKNINTISDIDVCKDLKIGGLTDQVETIIKKAFMTRNKKYKEICKDISFTHTKGIILYGPPGTGKTLIARSLSENILKCNSLKIVNGPELLDKWVGSSEKNMRELFEKAESGTDDELHVIIFDEIDSICKKRSHLNDASSSCQSNIVNTLLSKMDGINKLNNILIIGMTNNIEVIDKALLRSGRFDVQIKIDLPDEKGRREIFDIHLSNIKKHFTLDFDQNILSTLTPKYSGADIENLIRKVVTKKMVEERNKGDNILYIKDFENEILN